MKKHTVAVWIGVFALVGAGIGVLVRAQTGGGGARTNVVIFEVDRDPSEVTPSVADPLAEQSLDGETQRAASGEHLRRTTLSSVGAEVLPFPELPSRVMPAPVAPSTQSQREVESRLAPSPLAPSKSLPEIGP